jgi:hypothetical protein
LGEAGVLLPPAREETVTVTLYDMSAESFVPMLRALSDVLDKGAEHARQAKIDPKTLVTAQLAPDMYPLSRQVQIACEHAAGTIARLTGREAPQFENTEQTMDALKKRIDKTILFVEAAKEKAFAGAETRSIDIPGPPGMKFAFTGHEFLRDWALPHFYFHVVTAYDILRHEGVQIGKPDYLSNVGKYLSAA